MYFLGKCVTRRPHFVMEAAMRSYSKIKDVHVDTYPRYRLGRWEQVREHWRSHPGQRDLFPF